MSTSLTMVAIGLAMAHLLGDGDGQLCDVSPPLVTMAGLAMSHLLKDGGDRPGDRPAPLIVVGGLAMLLLLRVVAIGLPMVYL